MKSTSALLILIASLVVIGCKFSPSSSTPVGEAGRVDSFGGGNAEAYSGIIKQFEIVPGYTCRNSDGVLVPSYKSRLTIELDGSILFGRDACSPSEIRIPRDEVDLSVTKLVSTYDKALYQTFEGDPLSAQNTLTTAWCKTTADNPSKNENLLGKKPSGDFQSTLFTVTNGVPNSPKVFSTSYYQDPGKRIITSTDPNVSFSITVTSSTVNLSSGGFTLSGFMTQNGNKTPVDCFFNK